MRVVLCEGASPRRHVTARRTGEGRAENGGNAATRRGAQSGSRRSVVRRRQARGGEYVVAVSRQQRVGVCVVVMAVRAQHVMSRLQRPRPTARVECHVKYMLHASRQRVSGSGALFRMLYVVVMSRHDIATNIREYPERRHCP